MSEPETKPRERINITIPLTLQSQLDDLKIIPEEPWYKVIQRLIDAYHKTL